MRKVKKTKDKSTSKETISSKEAKRGKNSAKLIEEVAQEFETNDKGPEVDPSISNTINKKWGQKMDIKLLRERMQKYPIPNNCDKLCVPKVNLPVWKRLNRFVRTKDIRISNIQRTCVAAGAALAGGLHSLVTSDSVQTEPLIRCLTDALVMMGHVNYDLSLVRRDRMRPNLSSDYQDLCNNDNQVTTLLFGDDIHKEMKECKESKKLGHDLSYKGSFKRSFYKKSHGKDFRKGRKNFKRKKIGKFPKKGRKMESSEED